jgi:hypothetical protein
LRREKRKLNDAAGIEGAKLIRKYSSGATIYFYNDNLKET